MTKTATRIWDPAEHLQSDEDMAAYLEAALEEGDAALFAAALGDIARAKGMSQLARETGLGRESLYKALSPSGNPEFATILRVVGALGSGCVIWGRRWWFWIRWHQRWLLLGWMKTVIRMLRDFLVIGRRRWLWVGLLMM